MSTIKVEANGLKEFTVPEDGLLLKVAACGLTDTDLKVLHGELTSKAEYLGSQIVGTVEKIGENTSGFVEGDRLMVSCYMPCGDCRFCRNGETDKCLNRKTFGLQLSGGLRGTISLSGTELKRGYVAKIPHNLKFEEACAADVAAAIFSAHRKCGIGPGMKILVMGCGPAGCMHTHLAKLRGVDVIIQSDIAAGRMEMARPFMADYLLDSTIDNVEKTVRAVTDRKGVDIVIVATNRPEALNQAIKNTAVGGKILLFSRFGEIGENIPINITEIQRKQLTILGTDGYTKEDVQEILWLAGKRKITLKWLVTSVIDPDDIPKKAEELAKGKELRVVVHP